MPRLVGLLGLAFFVGCHNPTVMTYSSSPRSTAPAGDYELPTVIPSRIEPTLAELPAIQVETADPHTLFAADEASFRGLDEIACRQLAAQNSPIGNLLDQENEKPRIQLVWKKQPAGNQGGDELIRELRELAAKDARHRDAAEALDRFYQLADAEARTDLLASGLKSFDEFVKLMPRVRDAGLPGLDDDEIRRQRAKLLGDLESAEAGIQLLNVELQTRLGLSVKGNERLWPTGSFEIDGSAIDPEPAVANALSQRADLQFLRALHLGLNAETLPTVAEQLKTFSPLAGSAIPSRPSLLLPRRLEQLTQQLKAATRAEVEVRKRQLYDLIAEREKRAAAEVRTSALQMASAARRVALAKARQETWHKKVEKAKTDQAPYDRLPAEIEWYRARADVVQEVMAWHRWRVKSLAAQGLLLEEPAEPEILK